MAASNGRISLWLGLCSLPFVLSCGGGGGGGGQALSVVLTPTSATLLSGASLQFAATVTGSSNAAVVWTASGGTITTGGLYTAPSAVGTYQVAAISQADPSQSATAAVTVAGGQPITVTVSPSSVTLPAGGQQAFAASLTGTSETAVTWTASSGSITADGVYTAPSEAGAAQVTATSQADPSKSASATVTITAAASGGGEAVRVAVSPSSVTVETGARQQFTATVTGTANTAVGWTATGGSITTAGLYTAPSAAGTYQITATSEADPGQSAAAVITVVAPVVKVAISPLSVTLQAGAQQAFTATVTGTANTLVTWAATGGPVTTAGVYTAPSAAGTYQVTVTSQADPSMSATATVTVTAASPTTGDIGAVIQ